MNHSIYRWVTKRGNLSCCWTPIRK